MAAMGDGPDCRCGAYEPWGKDLWQQCPCGMRVAYVGPSWKNLSRPESQEWLNRALERQFFYDLMGWM